MSDHRWIERAHLGAPVNALHESSITWATRG